MLIPGGRIRIVDSEHPGMGKMVSMKDVAEQAGVHPSTVSLCLKNSSSIPLKTRERVKQIAHKLGYRPHPFVQSLMRSRRTGHREHVTPLLAFVTFFPTRDGWKSRSLPGIEGMLTMGGQNASSRGFELQEFWGPLDKYTPQRLSDILYNRGIKGVIFTQVPTLMEQIDWSFDRFACVTVGTSLQQPGLHRVRSNHFGMIMTAMDQCHRMGYRRLGLAMEAEFNLRTQNRWLAGWLLKQRELNVRNPPEPLLTDSWTRKTFSEWMRENRPDLILTLKVDDVCRWLEEDGHKVPQDIGVLSISAKLNGRHTGICEDWEMHGVRAVNLLVELLTINELGLSESPVTSLVEGKWNPGKTTRDQH